MKKANHAYFRISNNECQKIYAKIVLKKLTGKFLKVTFTGGRTKYFQIDLFAGERIAGIGTTCLK